MHQRQHTPTGPEAATPRHEATYRLRVGTLHTPFVVRLRRDADGCLHARSWRRLLTPLMAEPLMPAPSGYAGESMEDAMRTIAAALRVRYEQAVEMGHTPVEAWLV